jgi:tetratricopeptide (TPR) repeat protein
MHCLDEIGFLVAGSADYRASVEPLERALAIADELGDAAGRVSALSRLTLTSANRLQLDRAERSGALALEIAEATGDEQLVATALDALKQVSLMTGRFDEVERFGAQLRPLYERRHDRWLQQFVELETGLSSFMRWRFDEARGRLERSLAINRELNDDGNEPLHIMMLSHYHRCRGAVAPAIETGRRSLTLAREREHLEWIAQAASILGGTLLQLGAREEAIDVLRSGVDAAERSGAAIHAIQCTGQLVRAVSSSSDEEAVRAVLRSAEAELAQVGLPPGELLLFDWDGLIGIAAGWIVASAPERALELTDPIVQACVARGWPEAAVDASLVRAAALTALEDREGALEAARLADEWCQRYEVPLYAWRAAEAVASCADAGEAEEARERARASADALLASIDEASLRSQLADEVDRVIARGGAAWA